MSIDELSDELVQALAQRWPCRDQQLLQLRLLVSQNYTSPSTIVLQGPRATGKSSITQAHLQASNLRHVIIRCEECITERHLLEKTIAAVEADLSNDVDDRFSRCENLNSLASHLSDLLRHQEKYVIVFDGVDKQREASPTLSSALARLGEVIPALVTVLVVRDSLPGTWRRPGIPHINFPAYTRGQAIHIVCRQPLDIFTEAGPAAHGYTDAVHQEDKAWLWPRFCAAIWDSLGQSAARDLESYTTLCHKLWTPFVDPVVRGDYGTRDFSRLMVVQRKLFQDEDVLLDHIMPESQAAKTQLQLPYFAKWLLLAAFLASTNPARLDAVFFMKSTDKKKKKRGGAANKAQSNNKMPRHLMAPSPFPLDRLLAIVQAILPDELKSNIDIYTQIATLTSLRLLARSSGIGLGDALDTGSKWRLGPVVTWELIASVADSLDFEIRDYTAT